MPFILCGGAGTRLWPLSREAYPKQFHRLTGPDTLFQQTCQRLSGPLFGGLHILSNHRHRFLVADQIEEIGAAASRIVIEPEGRNTAPAACVASLIAARFDEDALVLLAPSDHMIGDTEGFVRAVESGVEAAEAGSLVVFGVEPDCPHTGYGYIETEAGNRIDLKVKRFVEKPDAETAERYLDAGSFYWNAGIFLFKAGTMLDLLATHAPEILDACRKALDGAKDDLSFHVLGPAYRDAQSISLDYAVAEKAGNVMRCVPLNTPWNDVGSWSALWNFMDKDAEGNATGGDGEIILENTRGSLAYSNHACVALVGVENLVVVAMEDAVLVASKDHAEAIKRVVDYLKGNGGELALQHNRVYRPWGWYQSLNRGDRYQVKCIMVRPGGKLSLQSHHHRSEHWVVVTGTVEVTRGQEVAMLSENQSTYIPIGEKHRLANPGKIPAFLIEVQSGPYLNEDDIVRYDDIYRRGATE
ncbi:mannose-1-phosphate guanylyltransferase/mannose-6-phosphate isomerase [Methyloceanibacter sp.]|uniref:mannose-1-phosphate guanylyltransferase/mannose-6-phosphate isomerase n=1 Tax=Methyloceanibacter sp. TaxID=1965321 RepID=UPI002D4546C0|nr:mannose-1-phosphate guanylyltransferase/mannose-6-phosphate isomerase [Methyloceanibacter sp.]HZP07708.1 mannose-1-phosphate guanylyltransferase/mannose-6-phosphate isomerase [Methyloceanibacter sp.]